MNWGTKLLLGMGAFIAFIITLGALMILRGDRDALLDQNYYEKGQHFDRDMEEKQHAVDDRVLPEISLDDTAMHLGFPAPASYELTFLRAADATMDRRLTGTTEGRTVTIRTDSLAAGPWTVRIAYTVDGKKYLFEDQIVLP